MKRFIHTLLLYIGAGFSLLSVSCIREDVSGNTPEANFESLWRIIDQQYCFLDYKHEVYGLDWNEVHERYARRITPSMTNENLFEVLSDMVNELRDGHVNLSSSMATSQYREWFDSYPRKFQRQHPEQLSRKRLYHLLRTGISDSGKQQSDTF